MHTPDDITVKNIEIDDATVTADNTPLLDISKFASNAQDFTPVRDSSEVYHSGEDTTDKVATVEQKMAEGGTSGSTTDIEIAASTSSANTEAISVHVTVVIASVFVFLL